MMKAYYKKKIIDLRARLEKEKEAKKRDNAYYAEKVREASGPSNKAYYRRCKVDHAAAHDRTIASIKRDIESAKESLKRCK
ncbi:MAG: hypothetical protein IJW88_02180 [Alistipes sp.]|nr:hypothetical protein [Rikenellaceae bacterium]MBQ7310315.1 hypothetical protein [Alistipes sp.]